MNAGVSAVGQVLSFYTQAPLGADAVQAALSAAAPTALRAHTVELAPRTFHGETQPQPPHTRELQTL